MRRLYEPRDREQRAHLKRIDADQCLRAGYTEIAHVNAQEAAYLAGEDHTQIAKIE